MVSCVPGPVGHQPTPFRETSRSNRRAPPRLVRSSVETMEAPTNPLKIVSVGGGNGLSTLLRGLKRYVKAGDGAVDLTAVVTVTDDGGSSGRLRRDFDVLPPGDIRKCMVALSGDENLFGRLFEFRFL